MHRSIAFLFTTIIMSLLLTGAPERTGVIPGTSAQTGGGYLLLNEISPFPSDGSVWVELINPTSGSVELDGWTIEFLSGFEYTFPANSGDIGSGNLHVLGISGENPLDQDGDGCILSGPDGVIDVIQWGLPFLDSRAPLSAGEPLVPFAPMHDDDEPLHLPDDVIMRIPNTWPPGESSWLGSEHWAYRDSSASSRGSTNPMPPPVRTSPPDGAVFASDVDLTAVGLEWADSITFQIARDSGFQDIVVEQEVYGDTLHLDNLDAGTYYWRVRGGSDGEWSQPLEFTREPYDLEEVITAAREDGLFLADNKGGGATAGVPLAGGDVITSSRIVTTCPHIMQYKDTTMVCLMGCDIEPMCPWDNNHNNPPLAGGARPTCEHGNSYCTRASIAMVAGAGGKSISQDRISYYQFEEMWQTYTSATQATHLNSPINDLGHKRGTGTTPILLTLDWLYGQSSGASTVMKYNNTAPNDLDGVFAKIKQFIDAGTPVLRCSGKHATIVSGYAVIRKTSGVDVHFLRIEDPWINTPHRWLLLETTIDTYKKYLFPPPTGSPIRSDEAEIGMDSDSDGLNDFDEINRFKTDPNDDDTDSDGVKDLEDILGYVFMPDGQWLLTDPDIDGDGNRKEDDPDNDNAADDGTVDGCEDANHNGFFEANGQETSNFDSSDDGTVVNPQCSGGWIEYRLTQGSACPDTWERIDIDGMDNLAGDGYVHSYSWDFHGCLITSLAGTSYISSYTHHQGEGAAELKLERDANGGFYLYIDTQPTEIIATTEYTIGSESGTFDETAPLSLHNWYLEPHELGQPEENANGGWVFRGFIDVFTGFDPSSGQYMSGQTTPNTPSGFDPLAGAGGGGSSIISWEIWIQSPETYVRSN